MPAFLAPIAVFFSLFQELWSLFKKPKYRTVLIWMLVILLTGTIFYHRTEGWSWLDSLYFSVITLATIGYGDLVPTTDSSKIFTMAYILIGFSVFISFASMLTQERIKIHQARLDNKDETDE
jgi:voltage-gated potassium channel Kch